MLQDVVNALTVAYDILVGGLLVPILGGLVWRRGNDTGALAAMAVGTVATLAAMFIFGIEANEPIYWGLVSGLVVFVGGSLLSKPTDPDVLAEWDRRSRGESPVQCRLSKPRRHNGTQANTPPRAPRPNTSTTPSKTTSPPMRSTVPTW